MILVTGKVIETIFRVSKNTAYEMIKTAKMELKKPRKCKITLKEFAEATAYSYENLLTELEKNGKK